MTKTQRLYSAILAGVIAWFTLFSTFGYFVGVQGVGLGWLAFWAVGGLSLIPVVLLAVIVFVLLRVVPWIERGRD